jgi:hypothetical protein
MGEDKYSNIISKCEVLKFEDFINKKLLFKGKKSPNLDSLLENVYFVQQKYLVSDDHFLPDLTTYCYCDQPFNPDKNFIKCKECKGLIHSDCFLTSETKKCYNCSNNIELQLNATPVITPLPAENMNNASNQFIGVKRTRKDQESDMEVIIDKEPQLIKKESFITPATNTTQVPNQQQLTTQIHTTHNIESSSKDDSQISYSNLSEERRRYLTNLSDKIMKTHNNLINNTSVPLSSEEKNRKNIRDKIMISLVK